MRPHRPSLAIAGIGTTHYRRSRPESHAALAAAAVRAALDDAGLTPDAVDGLITEGAVQPRELPADALAAACGIRPAVSVGWLVGAAGTVGAALLARQMVATGDATTVVVVQVMGGTGRTADPYAYHAHDPVKAAFELPMGFYGQAVYFAAMAQRYRHEHGLSEDALAAVAAGARAHAARTPGAQRDRPLDRAAYDASPWVAEPLRAADCCLVSEGATAYVLTTAERAANLRRSPVLVAGVGVASSGVTQSRWFTQRPEYLATGAAESGRAAFTEAGLSPADVDLAQVYDCFSITPLLQLEELGLAGPGEAAEQAAAGRFAPGGDLPLNTHGGLLAYGFCLGISHVNEAVAQLRGDRGPGQVPGARVALVAGLGVPHHATLLLTKGDRDG